MLHNADNDFDFVQENLGFETGNDGDGSFLGFTPMDASEDRKEEAISQVPKENYGSPSPANILMSRQKSAVNVVLEKDAKTPLSPFASANSPIVVDRPSPIKKSSRPKKM